MNAVGNIGAYRSPDPLSSGCANGYRHPAGIAKLAKLSAGSSTT